MAYITKETVSRMRKEIKKAFPSFKFSIINRDYSQISVYIMKGDIDFGSTQEQINHFYIADHYKNNIPARDMLLKIYNIIKADNRIVSEDGDYGSIPNYYMHIEIGKWDKPYIYNVKIGA